MTISTLLSATASALLLVGCSSMPSVTRREGEAVTGDHVLGYSVSYERLRPFHLRSGEQMAATTHEEDGAYELQLHVSRLTTRHGRVTETLISQPRLRIVPGVPVLPLYPDLKAQGSIPFSFRRADEDAGEHDVTSVAVAWEGDKGDSAVCTVKIERQKKVVSVTQMKLRATEQ